jgi:8-oxo-dGTP pyrophosphatase MutT (NUDIX family)
MTQISRERHAARVLLMDEQGRVLLVKGHDADNPARQWWFSVGGGIEPGENEREAAVRELFEETGIRVAPHDLEGPVLTRSDIFDFQAEHVLQHEVFFTAQVSSTVTLSRSGWTDLERSFVDDLDWLSVTQIRHAGIEVFPRELATIVENLHSGWNGEVLALGVELTRTRIAVDISATNTVPK